MITQINISDASDFRRICERIGFDSRAIAFLQPKFRNFHIYAEHVDFRAASFLKQELLSRGGDCVVAKHVIDAKTEFSDVLLIGTEKQLRNLLEKLRSMDCWGLREFREEFADLLRNIFVNVWEMSLPNNRSLKFSGRTKLMAIMNVTPDSFFADSRLSSEREILHSAEKFLESGADILDIGGESTRPGARQISESEELARVIPAVKLLRKNFPGAIISLDTYKSGVANAAALEGVDIINDISGFSFDAKIPEITAKNGLAYVLTNFRADNSENQNANLLSELDDYFREKLAILENSGVKREKIILDPGLGFGKNISQNLQLVKHIEFLRKFACPILVGHSRKRFTQKNLLRTLAVSAYLSGKVQILRVHDICENFQILDMLNAIKNSE